MLACVVPLVAASFSVPPVYFEDDVIRPVDPVDRGFGWTLNLEGDLLAVSAFWSATVFLFDANTGEELYSIGDCDTCLGAISRALSAEHHVVRRLIESPGFSNGERVVSVYDVSTGELLYDLRPSAARPGVFGELAVISNGLLAIADPSDSTVTGNDFYSNGAVYIFDIGTGDLVHTLFPADLALFPSAGERFGNSIDMSGDTLIVGGWSDRVHLFNARSGELIRVVNRPDTMSREFGSGVGLSGDLAAIADPGRVVGVQGQGLVYGAVHIYDVINDVFLRQLDAYEGSEPDGFGLALAFEGDLVLAGSRFLANPFERSGAAYLFSASTGEPLAKFVNSTNSELDNFGQSVDLSGATAAISAFGDDIGGDDLGGVFLFRDLPPAPSSCSVADIAVPLNVLDLSDVDAFIAAFVTNDPLADIAAPFGLIDLTDVDSFIGAYAAGCP